MAGVHTMNRTDLPRTRTNPQSTSQSFAVRLRGVDPGEVRSFLTGLADGSKASRRRSRSSHRKTNRCALRSTRRKQTPRNWPPTRQ